MTHPDIADVAVVGVEDDTWGQVVAAVVVTKDGRGMALDELKLWCREKMPKYWIPNKLKLLADMPRNVMGKVNKKELVKNIFPGK